MPTKGSCNSDNYQEYSSWYGPNGRLKNSTTGLIDNSKFNYDDADYACYAQNTLNSMRAKLDPQIAALYNPPDSTMNVSELNYNGTMLSGVLWVMLGTTVLYYTFTKL